MLEKLGGYLVKIKQGMASHKKFYLILGVIIVIALIGWNFLSPKTQQPQYQTAQVTRGTLITSVSASGSVSVANKASVTTQASGVISQVLVKNGDMVASGQTIATVTLDQNGQQKQAAAWSSLLSAQNTFNAAQAQLYTLQNLEFIANQKFMNDAVANGKPTADPLYVEENAAWLAAEAAYKNQTGVISQAQAAVSTASLSYQAVSSTITAPIAGKITDLTLTPGMQLSGSSTTSSSNATTTTTDSGQAIASIKTDGTPIVSISIAEVDIPKVTVGDKATLTFDALPNQTFTGKIIGINTTGAVSSGVTTYPATIALDSPSDSILPNMSVTAHIITKVDDNVLMVPTAAIQTGTGGTTVRVLQNGQINVVDVTTADASDTQTQIISGLSEGETIVTGVTSQTTTFGTSSPFSGTLRVGGLGGGAGFGGGAQRTTTRGGGQ
ncbi:MAG TPA: HlyD family efflux transporter periplasmic adaptor subunit [Patescibacteria group bacterium]|nr:HlyD family efflux transporter periplasmic adaptor subunit [Patescibacteria group bacterium]